MREHEKVHVICENLCLEEGMTKEQIKEQTVFYFNSVAAVKASNHLKAEMSVQTLGYYSANDGGAATYKIREKTQSDVIDDGSIIECSDTLVAELIVKDNVNVKQFGAKGDGIHDDTDNIQKAIDFSYDFGNKNVYVPAGRYITSKAIFLYEKCILRGESKQTTTLNKISNTKTSIPNFDYDAILIFANRDLSNTESRSQQLNEICLEGNVTEFIEGKTESTMQYGIIAPTGCPKIIVEKFKIMLVDIGIQAKTMWMATIRDSEWLQAEYRGIYVKTSVQGLNLQKLNIDGSHIAGIDLTGGFYSTISNILIEYIYGGTAYKLSSWGGYVVNCGYEMGYGPEVGFELNNAHVKLSGGYLAGVTTTPSGDPYVTDCTMIKLIGSTMEIDTTNFGYDLHGTEFDGKLAHISNSHLTLDNSNKYDCTFKNNITAGADYGYLTVDNKTVEIKSGIIYNGDIDKGYYHIDDKINKTPSFHNKNIFMDTINTPTKNSTGDYSWGRAYRKGDAGFINNPLVNGKALWICNRDNINDTPQTTGTITAVNSGNLVLSDVTLENYSDTGIRIYPNSTIEGVTSGATCNVSSVDKATNTIYLGNYKDGEFIVGEKIKLKKTSYAKESDYLYVGIINSGKTAERPNTSLVIGEMYFDTSLNKPVWYKGNNQWVDSTGTVV